MKILICAATEFEIQPTRDLIRLNGIPDIEVLITGVGLMSTTYRLSLALQRATPDCMIQAGIGGCIDHRLPLTKIVAVEREIVGDMGVMENGKFRLVSDMGFADRHAFPFEDGWLVNSMNVLQGAGITTVAGVSVNQITTDPRTIDYYRNDLDAAVESMEGAAFHYVALMHGIPFIQLRSLSNFVGERDKSKWMMKESIGTLNHALEGLISKFAAR